jgi:hypothetical protein
VIPWGEREAFAQRREGVALLRSWKPLASDSGKFRIRRDAPLAVPAAATRPLETRDARFSNFETQLRASQSIVGLITMCELESDKQP